MQRLCFWQGEKSETRHPWNGVHEKKMRKKNALQAHRIGGSYLQNSNLVPQTGRISIQRQEEERNELIVRKETFLIERRNPWSSIYMGGQSAAWVCFLNYKGRCHCFTSFGPSWVIQWAGPPVYYDRKGKERKGKERGFVSNFDSRRGEKKKRKRLLEVVAKLMV